MAGLYGDLLDFIKQPFSPTMSAYQWFLFYGLLIVIAIMWHMIFRALSNAT